MASIDRIADCDTGFELPYARRLVVMAKEPIAGRVKSRLARDIGSVRAVSFYRSTLRALLLRVVRPHRWQTYLAVSPDYAWSSRSWFRDLICIPQGHGDLGCRMQRILKGCLLAPW